MIYNYPFRMTIYGPDPVHLAVGETLAYCGVRYTFGTRITNAKSKRK